MTTLYINTGSGPNAGDGDSLRTAFNKVNANFTNFTSQINNAIHLVQSDRPPVPASTTTVWFDTVSGRNYVYFDGSWIDSNPSLQYQLPAASTSTLGGVKIDGTTIRVNSSGTISAYAPVTDRLISPNSTYSAILDNAGSLTAPGTLTVPGTIYQGIAYDNNEYTDTSIRVDADTNSYAQMIMKNHSSGTQASTDLVLMNDLGDDFTSIIDLGINSSQFSWGEYSINSPGSGYLFTNGGDLTVGTQTPNTSLIFHAGGTTSSNAGGSLTEHFWNFNRPVYIEDNQQNALQVIIQNTNTGTSASSLFSAINETGSFIQWGLQGGNNNSGVFQANDPFIFTEGLGNTFHIGAQPSINFYANKHTYNNGEPTLRLDNDTQQASFLGDVVPLADLAQDLGSTSSQWRNVYAENIIVNGSSVITNIPTASTSTLGGVKIDGNTIQIDNSGTISVNGAVGPQGSVGAQGPQGVQGSTGAQGYQGSIGAQGAQGFQGVVGAQGSVGAQGAVGAQGFQGAVGAQGFQGTVGAQGAVGNANLPADAVGFLNDDGAGNLSWTNPKSLNNGTWTFALSTSGVVTLNGTVFSGGSGFTSTSTLINTVSTATLKIVAPPLTVYGSLSDVPGNIAFDKSFIYYCTGTFGNVYQSRPIQSGINNSFVYVRQSDYAVTPQTGWILQNAAGGPIYTITSVSTGVFFSPPPSVAYYQLNIATPSLTFTTSSVFLVGAGSTAPIWIKTPWNATTASDVSSLIANSLTNYLTTASYSSIAYDMIPAANLTYNLGSTSSQWKSLYVGTSTIYLGGIPLTVSGSTLNVNGTPIGAGGVVSLTNLNSDITFSTAGVGAPTFNTTSSGTKISYYPSETASTVDYATGIEAGVLWNSIPSATNNFAFKWYGGTSTVASLNGLGTLTANKFVGDGSSLTNVTVTQQANIVGVQPNVTLVAGNYSYVFDNAGNFTMPTNGDIIVPGASGNINVGNTVYAAQTGTTGGYAFVAGPGASSQAALLLQGLPGVAANMAIRDNSTVSSNIFYDVSIGGTNNGTHQFRGTSSYTQYAQIDRYGINLPTRPAFRVYGAGTTGPLSTTQNTNGVLNSNNWAVDYQQGSALNGTTGVFTAPVTGLYQVNLIARTSSNTGVLSQIIVQKNSGGTLSTQIMIEWAANTTMNHTSGNTIVKMAAGDTLVLKVALGTINFDANDNWSVAYIG